MLIAGVVHVSEQYLMIMKLNLEIMAEILPSIRAEMAKELVYSHKLSQSEVSRMLGVSQPAVSQYVRQLRGTKTVYDGSVRQEIKSLCEKIVNGKTNIDLENELYNLCKFVAQNRIK